MKQFRFLFLALVLSLAMVSCVKETSRYTKTSESTYDVNKTKNGLSLLEGNIFYQYFGTKKSDADSKIFLVSLTKSGKYINDADIFKNKTYTTEADDEGNFKFTNLPKDQYMLLIKSDNIENPGGTFEGLLSDENKTELQQVINNKNKLESLLDSKMVMVKKIDFNITSRKVITQDFGHKN